MKNFLLIATLVLAIFLRSYHYLDRTTYGWDQARDIQVLETATTTNQLPLLGPIVRGATGGFYLGPIYHYLLLPLYSVTKHTPLVLVWLSIFLDVVVVLGLTLGVNPSAGLIWAISSMLINSSLTPWNVSLIHPWVLAVLLLQTQLTHPRRVFLFLLILATATSIHLTLLPLAGIFFFIALRRIRQISHKFSNYFSYTVALFLPQLPLILSDFKTSWSNSRAFKDFLFVRTHIDPPSLFTFGTNFVQKLGATVSRLFVGEPYLVLGLLLIILLVIFGFRHYKKHPLILPSLLIIAITFISLWLYRDLDFAEYYFNAMLVPLVILGGIALARLALLPRGVIMAGCIYLNLISLSFAPSPFGLGVKQQLIRDATPFLTGRADLQLLLPDYQQFGFAYFLNRAGVSLSPEATRSVVIAPASQEHVSAPPHTPSVIYQASRAAFRLVVFSN